MKLRLRLPSPASGTRIILLDSSSETLKGLKERVNEELGSISNVPLSPSQFCLSLNGKEPLPSSPDDDTTPLSSLGIVHGDLIRLIPRTSLPAAAAAAHTQQERREERQHVQPENTVHSGAYATAASAPVAASYLTESSAVMLVQLVDMGFDEQRASVALSASGNDFDQALDILSEDVSHLAKQTGAEASMDIPRRVSYAPTTVNQPKQDTAAATNFACSANYTTEATGVSPSGLERLSSLYDSAGVTSSHHAMTVLLHWIIGEMGWKSDNDFSSFKNIPDKLGWWQMPSSAHNKYELGDLGCLMTYVWIPRTPYGAVHFNSYRCQPRKVDVLDVYECNFVDYSIPFSAGARAVYSNADSAARQQLVELIKQAFQQVKLIKQAFQQEKLPEAEKCTVFCPLRARASYTIVPQDCVEWRTSPDAALRRLASLYSRSSIQTRQHALHLLLHWIMKEMEETPGFCPLAAADQEYKALSKAILNERFRYRHGEITAAFMTMPRSSCGILSVSVVADGIRRTYSTALDATNYINIDSSPSSGVSNIYLQPILAGRHIFSVCFRRALNFIDNRESRYNTSCFLGLVPELLDIILRFLDAKTLLNLAATCLYLHDFVNHHRYLES
ncbi:uncharacterized protein LOC135806245 [Sycon ciliatum]|uniref:uncharacterized protein LOC135806245 n=1 Tax=Sycon ciliatum TaxID=27933 RepID=UPI0031F64C7F